MSLNGFLRFLFADKTRLAVTVLLHTIGRTEIPDQEYDCERAWVGSVHLSDRAKWRSCPSVGIGASKNCVTPPTSLERQRFNNGSN
jgi:hypothetical protein